jgi:hypothetical protein
MAKFKAIWSNKDHTILERVAATLEAGDKDAARLLSLARNPQEPAPKTVDPVFKNEKANAFYRANLALAYARSLSNRRVHEEALEILKGINVNDVVDPAAYLFHRAVCEHAMLMKNEAKATIMTLIREAVDAPERYKTVAALMLLDMQAWKDKDLAAIARKMDNVERRLELARGGPTTQKMQKEIIARLDELIKELENQAKQQQQGSGDPNGGQCPGGGDQPGDGQKPGSKPGLPNKPMQDSMPGGQSGTGKVDPAKIRKMIESWGNLPPDERPRIESEIEDLVSGLSPSHRQVYQEFFRRIREREQENKK